MKSRKALYYNEKTGNPDKSRLPALVVPTGLEPVKRFSKAFILRHFLIIVVHFVVHFVKKRIYFIIKRPIFILLEMLINGF